MCAREGEEGGKTTGYPLLSLMLTCSAAASYVVVSNVTNHYSHVIISK